MTNRWQGAIFFILFFVLAIGLSYLIFNENTVEHETKERKMAIALVNEDDGTFFNENKITFGDEFSNSIHQDDLHEWYVVSRGVAENGIERNAYDMMIVIPNDFSEKSLSIHLDRPEPVSLHYKVNATGHENVRAEAESTAEKVLNDFNTRLVDVYFASIISNLQDAQDNINEIIHKEKEYTREYQNQINVPLSQYTSQFERVNEYTETSKESFTGLESVLVAFEESLQEDAVHNQTFETEIDSVIKLNENHSVVADTFSNYFDQFIEQMHRGDVAERLAKLERENSFIHQEFQEDDDVSTIVTKVKAVEKRFKKMTEKVDDIEKDIQNKFGPELERVVQKRLDTDFNEKDINIVDSIFETLDESIHTELQARIKELSSLHKEDFVDTGLSEDTVGNITNVIGVTKRYNKEFGNGQEANTSDSILQGINEVKRELTTKGVTVKDHVPIPLVEEKDSKQLFQINIPDSFSLESLYINGKKQKVSNNEIELTHAGDEGFSVEAQLKLKDTDEKIDVTAPIPWNWIVTQESTEESIVTGKVDAAKLTKEADEQSSKSNQEDEGSSIEEKDNDKEESDVTVAENKLEQLNEKSTTIVKENNRFHQSVESSLVTDSTEKLINDTIEQVKGYYKLDSLYELYFGFDMTDMDIEGNESKLSALATSDSLYHFIHEEDVQEIVKKHLAKKVMSIIAEDLNESQSLLEKQIKKYKKLVTDASDQSKSLTNKIVEMKESANELNSEVTSVLDELADWREVSKEVANEKVELLGNSQDVQTAVMSLDSGYQPLLMASESLAMQANSNFSSMDRVYDTFDTIHKQTDTIQASGVNLIAQADDLANKLTEKAIEDANFADNFNDVLANSRVGDRQNEDLYRFLANPVQTKNDGIITKGDTFTPYFLMIVLTIITLFTAYVIHSMGEKRVASNEFTNESVLLGRNKEITLIAAGIGLIEGLTVGLLSFYLLNFTQVEIYSWVSLILLLTMAMLLVFTYLLRQLKMIGMFILLVVVSLYLLLTKSLGFHFENGSLVKVLQQVSPLQYGENIVANVIEGEGSNILLPLIILIAITLIGIVLNLVVFHKTMDKELENEEAAEAN